MATTYEVLDPATPEHLNAVRAGQLIFDDPDANLEFEPADRESAGWAVASLAHVFFGCRHRATYR